MVIKNNLPDTSKMLNSTLTVTSKSTSLGSNVRTGKTAEYDLNGKRKVS